MSDTHALSLFFAYMLSVLVILAMVSAILRDRRSLTLQLQRIQKPRDPGLPPRG